MLDTIFNILKVTVVVAVAAVFMIAINALISFISTIVYTSVVGEFLRLVSMFLPFNASVIFGAIGSVISGILAFLLAKKIFDLTSWSVSSI